MYIRCRECWGSTWVAPTESGLPRRRLHCAQCEREHRLDNLNSIGTTPAARHTAAVSCAERHELDLPTAYSVLLRLVDLAEAKRHCASLGEAHTELNYDWGFRGAVTAGYLSEAQAIERGNRETYATRLAERHGLPLSLAFSV
ncbi:MAG: hypothetical protein GY716_04975, partial [bacterium]|nr:hypothetical protein [bacterium]